jgi:hypothetical protein
MQVSNQFVSQFYTVLHTSPRNLHRFYSEASTLTLADTRPDGQHIVKTVTGQKVGLLLALLQPGHFECSPLACCNRAAGCRASPHWSQARRRVRKPADDT